MTPRRSTTVRLAAALAVSTLALAACGGSDDDAETDTRTDTENESGDGTGSETDDDTDTDTEGEIGEAASGDADSADGGEVLADNEPRDQLLEEVDPDGEFEDAVGSLSPETRYGIVAGQLDPEPSIEIDGTDVRLVFDGGSVANAFSDCIIAGVTQLETETLTVVYPDGEQVC